jgi:hypothetical protein
MSIHVCVCVCTCVSEYVCDSVSLSPSNQGQTIGYGMISSDHDPYQAIGSNERSLEYTKQPPTKFPLTPNT